MAGGKPSPGSPTANQERETGPITAAPAKEHPLMPLAGWPWLVGGPPVVGWWCLLEKRDPQGERGACAQKPASAQATISENVDSDVR